LTRLKPDFVTATIAELTIKDPFKPIAATALEDTKASELGLSSRAVQTRPSCVRPARVVLRSPRRSLDQGTTSNGINLAKEETAGRSAHQA
jgi:hypothetical protein